ncbi:hypothetical protein [Pararhizobium polonicum]|uniref:hypothetical protein n=1 Tax=Pararhizobium polonicum TaxID=1612624 RepID=UPI00083AEA3E|nr:hypothetical protein [Pararhizobium polonicum]
MAANHGTSPKALTAARRREASKPGRDKAAGRGSGLTPRVRQAIDRLVFGDDNDRAAIVRLEDAASFAGITSRALRAAMLKPAVDGYYQQQMIALRNGERAASIRTIANIRDDPKLMDNAAGATARLKAAERLAFDPPGQNINVNVGVHTNAVTPGYVIDLEGGRRRRLEHLERVVEESGIVAPWEHDDSDLVIDGQAVSDD